MTDIISLGAGVQSSALLLMADRGEFDVIPKYAIFADTGNEPDMVYEWLELLKKEVKNIEIITTSSGNIYKDTLEGVEKGTRFSGLPFYTLRENGKKGMLMRQCTNDYKIVAVKREIRRLLGLPIKGRTSAQVNLWMGISTDEIERVKPSRVKFITNTYPLIDKDMSRDDCYDYFSKVGLPDPPRSACIVCPFHSNSYWRYLKETDRRAWELAVDFDKRIRRIHTIDASTQAFLHPSCVPLDEVDLDLESPTNFSNECEGMCGI